jgi:peptidyl-prolyl cis-trans isomerase A (cyclophilin A)
MKGLGLLFLCLFGLSSISAQILPAQVDLSQQSPDSFLVSFQSTKGEFIMKAVRSWSPLAVDRLYVLARNHYYDGCVIYRVAETKSVKNGRVVQFGLVNDRVANKEWEKTPVKDEPVLHPHTRGSVCFARGGPNTRSNEIAIMLTPCSELDTVNYQGVIGFPTVAEVVKGMEVFEKFNGQYGNYVFDHEDSLYLGREYFDRAYPGLDRIISVKIIEQN